jgi:Ni/Co efflux regulator RcnB
MKIYIPILSMLMVAVLAACQVAPVRTSGSVDVVTDHARVRVVFTDHDREVIHHYYSRARHKRLPPGLAKRKRLPPGLEKQLVRHGRLPPGLEGRYLPVELERQLEPLPSGYARIRVGTKIVLIDNRTRVVLDVISDIVF